MKARFLKLAALDRLRADVPRNMESYRSGDFAWLNADPAYWFELDVEIDAGLLQRLHMPDGQIKFEKENCALLYRAMERIAPYEARDERLWAYLTHVTLLDYARQRWPIPSDDDDATAHVRKHFFARDNRQVERDNAASRLWWLSHLCARARGLDLEQSLEILLFRSDVRANIVERPTSAQCAELFAEIVRRLSLSLAGEKVLLNRTTFRQFMKEINSVGGFRLLDCLTAQQARGVIDEIISDRLRLTAL